MEQPQQLNNNNHDDNSGGKPGTGGAAAGSASSFLCRQSSTRWTPTTDQIRILKDLYYNYGVRSPSADQIQRISARLRQYGKIEGKNVFYWFQNHKARERQKKRFVPDHTIPNPNPNPNNHFHHISPAAAASLRPSTESKPGDLSVHGNKYPSFGSTTGGLPSCSSSAATPGLVAFGQVANYGYGSTATMEKNFRNCSISTGGGSGGNLGGGGSLGHNFGWITVDPYPYSSRSQFDHKVYNMDEEHCEQEEEEDEEGNYSAREIETLPLFPIHDNISGFCGMKHNSDGSGHGGWYNDVFMGGSRASLELSLNSYTGMSPGSP